MMIFHQRIECGFARAARTARIESSREKFTNFSRTSRTAGISFCTRSTSSPVRSVHWPFRRSQAGKFSKPKQSSCESPDPNPSRNRRRQIPCRNAKFLEQNFFVLAILPVLKTCRLGYDGKANGRCAQAKTWSGVQKEIPPCGWFSKNS